MDDQDIVLRHIKEIGVSLSSLELASKVLMTKQEEVVRKLERVVGRLDGYGERLCSIESTQARHNSLFGVLGAGLVASVGLVGALFSR